MMKIAIVIVVICAVACSGTPAHDAIPLIPVLLEHTTHSTINNNNTTSHHTTPTSTSTTSTITVTSDHCSHQCNGRGICHEITTTTTSQSITSSVSYVCLCDLWFHGSFCEYSRREIEDSGMKAGACVNGCSGHGLCDIKSRTCTCDQGYTSPDCSEITLERSCAHLEHCSGKGFCVLDASKGEFACDCVEGFTGPDCSNVRVGACGGCRHGFCDVSDMTCKCYKGFVGDHCDRYILEEDPCHLSSFCSGNGICHEGTSICVCDSPSLLPESNCQKPYNTSQCPRTNGTICNNAGICNRNFSCECNSGYSGRSCERVPCGGCKHGTCEKTNGIFACVCLEGWAGEHCDTSLNEESDAVCCENECSGHGVCRNCVCDCFDGFSGNSCEAQVVVEASNPNDEF